MLLNIVADADPLRVSGGGMDEVDEPAAPSMHRSRGLIAGKGGTRNSVHKLASLFDQRVQHLKPTKHGQATEHGSLPTLIVVNESLEHVANPGLGSLRIVDG